MPAKIMVNTPWGICQNGSRIYKLDVNRPELAAVKAQFKQLFKHCGHCGATGSTTRCLGCEQQYYCNSTCQRADWGKHRVFCASCSKGKKMRPVQFLASLQSYRVNNPEFISFDMLNKELNVLDTANSLWVVTETKEYYEMRPQTIEVWNHLVAQFGEKWAKAQEK